MIFNDMRQKVFGEDEDIDKDKHKELKIVTLEADESK